MSFRSACRGRSCTRRTLGTLKLILLPAAFSISTLKLPEQNGKRGRKLHLNSSKSLESQCLLELDFILNQALNSQLAKIKWAWPSLWYH